MLRDGEVVARGAAEIVPGRRLNAIGAAAEIDPVEIHLENLVLGVFVLEPEGEQDFLDLEREIFVSLAGEPKSQERIWHMLQHNKPLWN